MSWAEEDWTLGLTGRVLQKVKELQVHHERLSRENKQKQLQLDNVHISLEKQTVKYEEVRVELQSVQRDLQSVQEEAKAAVTSKGRLTQEVQTKQAQVCSLEGQLDAARSHNNKLTQEVKRLEAELEKLQGGSRPADTTLFSTPSWIKTSPWEHNGSRQEVQRDEAPSRAHSRRLQFSDVASPSVPPQASPHRHLSDQSDIFSTPTAAFPWERDDATPATKRRPSPSSQTPPRDGTKLEPSQRDDCGRDHATATDTSSSELRSRVSALEVELSGKAKMLKSIQNEQMQSKKELAAKEISLQRARDELSVAQTRIAQDTERASATEHRLKQLQEELKCQRQNAESGRLQHQQRTKELERQHQRDVSELQRERQSLERQHQQELNKLNQELQHARTQHNALQAQADKLALQKQDLEKDLNCVKEKLKWTEGQLCESQRKEAQTQAKLTEAVREAEGVAVSLEQSRKRERALEEEGRRLSEERADALRLVKELQEQKLLSAPTLQPAQFCPLSQSYSSQSSFSHPARAQTKRRIVTRTEHKQVEQEEEDDDDDDDEELHDGKRTEVTASFPSDREPGEGIDSEHITALRHLNPECVEKAGRRGKSNEKESVITEEAVTRDISGPSKNSPLLTTADAISSISVDGAEVLKNQPAQKSLIPLVSGASTPSEDLKKENAMLRSDLQDLREELQKRLEDLEAQRRAETEARTRLKQLSRKQASQAVEKDEKLKEWKAELGSERAETERLKKTVAALEAALKIERDRNGGEEQEDGSKDKEDRECEMVELNIQLKKQLSDMRTQLAVEREERKQEEEKDQVKNKDLKLKVSELTAEVEQLKCRLKEEDKLSVTSCTVMKLSLHDDELNSNVPPKVLPSPEQHLLLCQTTNQRNVLESQSTAEIIQEERILIDPGNSPQPAAVRSEHETPDLVELLRRENIKETERADHCQVKLKALQSQVTRQTLQLTTAFEKQSQHIAGLLAELREKESVLCSQGDELLQCKKELEALRRGGARAEEAAVEDDGNKADSDDPTGRISDLKSKRGTQGVSNPQDTKMVPDDHVTSQRDETQVNIKTFDSETPAADGVEDDPAQQAGGRRCSKIAVHDEDQLVKPGTEDLVLPDTSGSSSQREPAEQSAGNAAASSAEEEETRGAVKEVLAGGQETFLHNVSRSEETQEPKMTVRTNGAEEEREEASQAQVEQLQEQVEALQLKIRALSGEMQQQAEELALWRLASQPAPAFDVHEQQECEEQICADGQTRQQHADGISQNKAQTVTLPGQAHTPPLAGRRRQENITVIREDDLLLSCTSNKMQGRMLFSRLQNSNIPEPKTLQHFKRPSALQEYEEESANMDQESEKENQGFNVLQPSGVPPASFKVKRDVEVVPMFEKTLVTRDALKSSGATLTKPDSNAGKPDVTPARPRETSETNADTKSPAPDVRSVGVQTDGGAVTAPTEEEEGDEEELVDSPPLSPVTLPVRDESDISVLFSGSFPIPADPSRLAERIRRNRTQLSAAFDDTEYEPYGLPEVVMKGFADIPSGPSCPYIVRRGLLGTSVMPSSQKDSGKEEETD